MRVHIAALQQAPAAQAPNPVQSVEHVFPLHLTRPLHAPFPRQVIVFMAPSACTPIAHDCGPEQVVWQEVPVQVTRPGQEPVPEQTIVFMVPAPVTPPLHEPLPEQVTLQGLPPHWTSALQALSAQRTVQLVESRQSIGTVQPEGGQSIEQPISFGHLMSVVHGLQALPQTNEQTPPMQVPPAAMQASQAAVATGVPHAIPPVPPAAVAPPPPPSPEPAAPP
jgi:hypothetical protein